VEGFRERIASAVGFVFDQIELESWQLGSTRLLALAWAEADTSPAIREMLLRRRREVHGVAVGLIQEGIARGELAVANGRDYAGGLQPTRRIVGRVDRDLSETLFRYPIGEEGNGLARHGRRRIFGRHRPDRALSDRAASGQNNRHSGEEPRQGAARQRVGWSGHDATITT
jgi:hypothetical protein